MFTGKTVGVLSLIAAVNNLCLLVLLACAVPGHAATFTAFGPKTYTRGTGESVTVTDTFSVANTSTIYELAVDSSAVSSAVITLNGKLVFAESDFNPNVAHLTKTVILHANNKLDVEVRSKPGSSVTVRITVVAAATTLNVHTCIFDASVPNGKGPAHGAGVQIQINGETAGVTDAMGSFSMMVTAGDLNIVGRIPAQAVGSEITIM